MAEKNGEAHSHSVSSSSRELRKKKRLKWLLYIALFAIFQTGIILLFVLTVMKIRTPKFRIQSADFQTFDYYSSTSNPSFNLRMIAKISIKNTNFGHYKFQESPIYFYYSGLRVGEALIRRDRAKARSTKRFDLVVDLSSMGIENRLQLGNDLNSGVLILNSQSRLNGKVELLKVFKKKKSTNMDCIIEINLALKIVGDLRCN